jgi:hypothetical protein
MRALKFRTPVICQNGHKAYWYWEIKSTELSEIFDKGVLECKKCSCPKILGGQGYKKNGDDEQYAELKDKNGKEIYEGDIVVFAHPTFIAEIYFTPYKGFMLKYLNNNARTRLIDERFEPIPLNHELTVEIIGNIYENKDLLKEEGK